MIARGVFLAIGSLALAAWSSWNAGSNYLQWQADQAVPRLYIDDAEVQVMAAETILSAEPERLTAMRNQVKANARAALSRNPLNAVAMEQLAQIAELGNQNAAGYEQRLAAEKISRRDLSNQIALINASASSEDTAGALLHYDRALKVHISARRRLFPQLGSALTEPEIRAELLKFSESPWLKDFMRQAVANDADPQAIADLLRDARPRLARQDYEDLSSDVLRQLIARNLFQQARSFVSIMPRAAQSRTRSMDFTTDTTDPSHAPLTWSLSPGEGSEVHLLEGQGLEVRIGGDRLSSVASRVSLLIPGTYTVTQTLRYAASLPRARLIWDLRCLNPSGDGVIWQSSPDVSAGQLTLADKFVIPEACLAQQWRLSAQSETTQLDSVVRLLRLDVSRN